MRRFGCASVLLLSTTLLSIQPAAAAEDGAPLPCNSLCRSWMSIGETERASAAERQSAVEQPPFAPSQSQPVVGLQSVKPKAASPARTEKVGRAPVSAVAVLPPRRPNVLIETHPAARRLALAAPAPVPPIRPLSPEPKVALPPAPAASPTSAQSAPAMIAAVEVPSVPEPAVVLSSTPEAPVAIDPHPAPVVTAPELHASPMVAMAAEPDQTAETNGEAALPSTTVVTPAPTSKAAPMGPPPFDVIAALLLETPRTQTPQR